MAESFKVTKVLLGSSGCSAHNEMYVTHLASERHQFECVGGQALGSASPFLSSPL